LIVCVVGRVVIDEPVLEIHKGLLLVVFVGMQLVNPATQCWGRALRVAVLTLPPVRIIVSIGSALETAVAELILETELYLKVEIRFFSPALTVDSNPVECCPSRSACVPQVMALARRLVSLNLVSLNLVARGVLVA
jgi:hypothetical protein